MELNTTIKNNPDGTDYFPGSCPIFIGFYVKLSGNVSDQ